MNIPTNQPQYAGARPERTEYANHTAAPSAQHAGCSSSNGTAHSRRFGFTSPRLIPSSDARMRIARPSSETSIVPAKSPAKATQNEGESNIASNGQVERHVAALSRPELIYRDSSILPDLERSCASCPLQRKLESLASNAALLSSRPLKRA
jgi:hypothetical protein